MIEEMLTIRPLPRSSMCSSAGLDMKKAPERLTRRTLCQSSSVILQTVLSAVMPALLTRMSSRPCCSMTSWIDALAVVRGRRRCPGGCVAVAALALELLEELLGALLGRTSSRPRLGALRRRAAADRGADAAVAAGDQGDPAVERPHAEAVVLGLCLGCHAISSLVLHCVRSARGASPRGRARSRCAPWSRPSGRCGRRGGRSASRPRSRRGRPAASCRARRDVVGAGRDDEQVLLDPAQVDALAAHAHACPAPAGSPCTSR